MSSQAEIQARKSFIICIQGGCFREDGDVVPGAPDHHWAKCERVVYVLESVGPRAMIVAVDRLQVNGFPFVEGDKRVIISRRPGISNPAFWSRTFGKALHLGGQVAVIGSDESQFFKYLLDHPEVAHNVPRIIPDQSWREDAVPTNQRRMIVRLTDLLWVYCATVYRQEQPKYAKWITQMLSMPSIIMHNEASHLVMPDEFQNLGSEIKEDSLEGRFLLHIRGLGYELLSISSTVPETRQTTRKSTTFVVMLR
jgi:hypothetical protein